MIPQVPWDTEIEWAGRMVHVMVLADDDDDENDDDDGDDGDGSVSPAVLEGLNRFITEIGHFDRLAREAIERERVSVDDEADDDEDESAVALYFEHHAEEIGTGTTDALHLVNISLHPDDPERLAVYDYSVDPERTNYVLAVSFDADANLAEIEMES